MKKNEVKAGGTYVAKVSDKLVNVQIDSTHSGGGWNATNRATGKRIRIKSARRLRHEVKSNVHSAATAKTSDHDAVDATVANDTKTASERATARSTPRLDRMPGDIVATAARQNRRKTSEGATDGKKPRAKQAAKPQAKKDAKPKRMSALDAAAQVLAKAGKPMRAQELITAMAEQSLWSSPAGKTPSSTLYASIVREVRDKGTASRFRKVDRGVFAFNKAGA